MSTRHPCYCTILRKATRRMNARYDAAMAEFGINIAQYSLLRAIEYRGTVSLTTLARVMELDRSTIGRNIRVLEKLGLVVPAQTSDAREAAITLADAGHRTLAAAQPKWSAVQAELDATLGPDGIEALLGQLQRL